MKKIIVAICLGFILCGCQSITREYGGTTVIKLEPNTKLEEITWKEDSLWYLTRPMTDDDVAETHTFQESSQWGALEGTVVIKESRE